MRHLNGDLLCVLDTETTGLDPTKHDLVQICVLPLNNLLEPEKSIMPFYMNLKPKSPENADKEAMKINKLNIADLMLHGIDPWKAADLFDEWFQKLNLAFRKKIAILGHNTPFDIGFVKEWLGQESYGQFFSHAIRDTMIAAAFINDRASFAGEMCPFPKVNLQYLCSSLGIVHDQGHDALQDCLKTAEVYRKLMLTNQHLWVATQTPKPE